MRMRVLWAAGLVAGVWVTEHPVHRRRGVRTDGQVPGDRCAGPSPVALEERVYDRSRIGRRDR